MHLSKGRRQFLLGATAAPLVGCMNGHPTGPPVRAAAAPPVAAPVARTVTVRGIPIHCEVHGTGRPLLMLHGFGVDHRMMIDSVEPLFARRGGWQRIYFDLPGMGKTPRADFVASADDMLDIVLALVDVLLPDQRFALVGQSYGGYLGRGVLARRSDRLDGMALLCPAVVADFQSRDLPPRNVLVKSPSLVASLAPADAKEYEAIAVIQSEGTWKRFRDTILPAIRAADGPFLERLQKRYAFSFAVDALPQRFMKPVLVVVGRQDNVVGYRDAARIMENYPRGTYTVVDRAGHNLLIEQPTLFEALMNEWLDRLET
ncbi:alpha/beta hydrolase [Pendulispora rubella]|uniref:Alpha/beta hydrolase n=1 Tax=Pendulispora rubella TaxID=2741070 RepID=A0ABZ2KZH5_9BACT